MAIQTKIGYGDKENIDNAISEAKIDEGDLVITKDTDELAFIKPDKTKVFIKSRSTKEHVLNGTDLGALSNGDSIPEGIDMDGFLEMITQKPIVPTYQQPSISMTRSGSGTTAGAYEAGTSITPSYIAIFNKGDAGTLTQIAILKNEEEVGVSAESSYAYNGESFVLGDETITYKAKATYEEGPIKNNNLGTPDATGQIKAGSKTSSEFVFSGQRNLFYGTGIGEVPELTSDFIRGFANKKLNPTQEYSFTINVAAGQQYFVFAYPATLRDVSKVYYVEGNDPSMAASLSKETVNVADARGGNNGLKAYKVFFYRAAVPFVAPGTMQVTI